MVRKKLKKITIPFRVLRRIGLACIVIVLIVIEGGAIYYSRINSQQRDQTLDGAGMEQTAREAGAWFERHQREDGSFNYEYILTKNEYSTDDNIVRQAGSLYGLAMLHRYFPDAGIRATLSRGIAYFETKIIRTEQDGVLIAYVQDGTSIQANTAAVFLLALVELGDTDQYGSLMQELGNYLVASQLEDGSFYNYYLSPTSGCNPVSPYNNGESFLALIRLYRLMGGEPYLVAAQRIAAFSMTTYSANPNTSFYSWGTQAFWELYAVEPQDAYRDFIYQQADWIITTNTYTAISAFLKRADVVPGGNSSVMNEGLTMAYELARRLGDQGRADRYLENIQKALLYNYVYQMPLADEYSTEVYEKARGGLCYNFYCLTQRIDMVHHWISACVEALRYLDPGDLDISLASFQ